MDSKKVTFVKATDRLSAKAVLTLLSDSVNNMQKKLNDGTKRSDNLIYATLGAIEVLMEIHNSILAQIKDCREAEAFERNDGGGYDA